LVSDYKERVRIPSKKRTISQINAVLRVAMWMSLGISASLILICAVAYMSNSALFHLKRVDVTGNVNVKKDEVLTLLDIELGDNILSWNMNAARMRLQKHQWIKDITISRSFIPASLKVSIVELRPIATLFLKDRPYFISEEGLVFASSPGPVYGLKVIATDHTRADMNQGLGQVIQGAVRAAALIRSQGLEVQDAFIEQGGLVDLRLKNNVMLTIFGDITPVKIIMAKRTLKELNPPEGTVMDLRCDDKVVLRNRGMYGSKG
jgi:hypothetical protein